MTSPTDTRTRSRTIPAIATTDEALSASAALVAAAAAAEIGLIIGCHKHYVRLGFINKKGGQYYIYKSTFVKASDALDASYKEFSTMALCIVLNLAVQLNYTFFSLPMYKFFWLWLYYRLFSCGTSKDGESSIVEWNESEGAVKRTYQGFRKRSLGVVQFDTTKNRFLAAGDDFSIKFWDMDNVQLLTTVDADGGLPVS